MAGQLHSWEKENLVIRTEMALSRCCTNSVTNCPLPRCSFLNSCTKVDHPFEVLKNMKKHPLKSLLKNIVKRENKQLGRTNPFHLGNTIMEHAESILGQPVVEHHLIKGDKSATKRIRQCTTLHQILIILKQQALKRKPEDTNKTS